MLRYGEHAYYFYNFAKGHGLRVSLSHWSVLGPGFARLRKAFAAGTGLKGLQLLSGSYHYGFNFFEQIAIMTVPHAVTPIGGGKFIINLWSYFGYIEIDCIEKTAIYWLSEDNDTVLGSQQSLSASGKELYYMSYSLADSMLRFLNPKTPVMAEIRRRGLDGFDIGTVWKGLMSDYLHDILLSSDGRFCVACELGMFSDTDDKLIPSKVLVADIQSGVSWMLERFLVAAHAEFDPVESHVIYFSEHNFRFRHTNIIKTLVNATYDIEFLGPAAVYKYRLTPSGPVELGVFTKPDLFRLTNIHVFMHRGQKILAAVGAPNYIFIADAESMTFIRKIEIAHPFAAGSACLVGTFSVAPDGEAFYVQTNKSFQIIDVASGQPLFLRPLPHNHMCSNHMQTSTDISW